MGNLFEAAARQRDKELSWIVGETVVGLLDTARKTGERLTRLGLCQGVARAVGELMLAREPGLKSLVQASDFEALAWHAAGKGDELLGATSDQAAETVAEICVIFVEMRRRGLPTPFLSSGSRGPLDIDPFANEGGFCNPIKIGMLSD